MGAFGTKDQGQLDFRIFFYTTVMDDFYESFMLTEQEYFY